MGLYLATVLGATVWVVLWGSGWNSFDGFLIGLLIVVIAATGRIFSAYLPGKRTPEEAE
jgi:hypothetical protein